VSIIWSKADYKVVSIHLLLISLLMMLVFNFCLGCYSGLLSCHLPLIVHPCSLQKNTCMFTMEIQHVFFIHASNSFLGKSLLIVLS